MGFAAHRPRLASDRNDPVMRIAFGYVDRGGHLVRRVRGEAGGDASIMAERIASG